MILNYFLSVNKQAYTNTYTEREKKEKQVGKEKGRSRWRKGRSRWRKGRNKWRKGKRRWRKGRSRWRKGRKGTKENQEPGVLGIR